MVRTALLVLLFSPLVSAQTYIDYPDGQTYTVQPNEKVYVTDALMYVKSTYADGSVYFKVATPSQKRDSVYTEVVSEQYPVGSHEWCKNYVPWSEGLSFSMVSWQRFCDTDGDGFYTDQDDGWSE
jgi:hypothetical protein